MASFDPNYLHYEKCEFIRLFFKQMNHLYQNKCFCDIQNLNEYTFSEIIYYIKKCEYNEKKYYQNHFHMKCICKDCHQELNKYVPSVCFESPEDPYSYSCYLVRNNNIDYFDDFDDCDEYKSIPHPPGFCINCTEECYNCTEKHFIQTMRNFKRYKSVIIIQRWWKNIITDPTSIFNNPRQIIGYMNICKRVGYDVTTLKNLQAYLTEFNLYPKYSYNIQFLKKYQIQNLINFLNRSQDFLEKDRSFITQMTLQNKYRFDSCILICLNINKIKVDFITHYNDGIIILPIMNTYLKISTSYNPKKKRSSELYQIYDNGQLTFKTKDHIEVIEHILFNMNRNSKFIVK